MEPVVVAPKAELAEEAPREERREPRGDRADRGGDRRREERGERRDERREPREDRREPREPREERRDYRRDRDLGPSVIGMGDHVPDFILRSFAIKPSKVEDLEEATTGAEG
jgi:hypothetical protein